MLERQDFSGILIVVLIRQGLLTVVFSPKSFEVSN